MVYTIPDTSVIWELLLSDASLTNEYDKLSSVSLMDISIDIKVIGIKNISLAVTADGYLQTNIFSTGKYFFIGEEKVQAFVDYVLANGTVISRWEPEYTGGSTDTFEIEAASTAPSAPN
jgi:hypothetical protein